MMKFVYWSVRSDGPLIKKELLLGNDESIPEPGGLEVLVRIKACGLSDVDLELLHALGQSRQEVPCGLQIAGIVTKVGSSATRFSVGDDVVGILPVDTSSSGCAEYCIVNENYLVVKPEKVSYRDAASCIGEGLKMYTALRYLGHLQGGETVLIMDGARPAGYIGIQLAQGWGAKVIATAASEEERSLLENMKPELAHVIDTSGSKRFAILNECIEDTGGLGVDCILDNGVNMYPNEMDEEGSKSPKSKKKSDLPEKHKVISALGVGGRWVTSQRDLQLDPPDARLLHLKGASVCFLNDATWTLSSHKLGKYLHILKDIMDKLQQGILRPPLVKSIALEDVPHKYLDLQASASCKKIIMEI